MIIVIEVGPLVFRSSRLAKGSISSEWRSDRVPQQTNQTIGSLLFFANTVGFT
jgi:hypothetical protein